MTGLTFRFPFLKPLRSVSTAYHKIRGTTQVYFNDMSWLRDYKRWPWHLRCNRFNRLPNVKVARSCYVAPTAILQLRPEGGNYGGAITIDHYCRIDDGAILTPYGGSIHLSENVLIGPYTLVYGQGGVWIGRDTIIAGHVYIVAGNHTFDSLETPIFYQPGSHLGIKIGSNVWIGGGAKVLDGVAIGDGCVIGAGSVVTKSLEPNSIAVGVPARAIGIRGKRPGPRPTPQKPTEQLT